MKNRLMLPLFLLFALLFAVSIPQAQTAVAPIEMEYLEVGGTPGQGLRLSRLIMGTDHLGKVPHEQTIAVLDEAVRLGINAFDTAPIYTDDIEYRFGNWLNAQKRTDLHVITKGGFPRDLGPGTYFSRLNGSKEQISANVLEEVRGSRAAYARPISIYLMHRDDIFYQDYRRVEREQTPVQTIMEALSEPRLRQNYLMIGVSNWATPRVDESQAMAREHSELLRPVCNSPYFSLLEMGPVTIHSGGVQVTHENMMDRGFQKGVRLMTYSPLGGFSIFSKGWETAKQNALALKNAKDRYWGNVYDAIFHEANEKRWYRAVAFIERFNARHGTSFTLDQLANAYALAHPRSDFVVIGPRTVEQLRRTVGSMKLAKMLTLDDLNYLHHGTTSAETATAVTQVEHAEGEAN